MSINVNEAVNKIKAVGLSNVRAVPMHDQNVQSGKYQIEIKNSNSWVVIAECPNKKIADDIISQAANNVILG
jgi:endoglucanase Acf2